MSNTRSSNFNHMQATISGEFPTNWLNGSWPDEPGLLRLVLRETSDITYPRLGIALDRRGTGQAWVRDGFWYTWDLDHKPLIGGTRKAPILGQWRTYTRVPYSREKYAYPLLFRIVGNNQMADAMEDWINAFYPPRLRSFL